MSVWSTDGMSKNERLAVGYVRVSKADRTEGKQSLSVEAQRAAIEAWAERTGRTIVTVYAEEDGEVSGDAPIDESPALLRAIQAVEDRCARWLVAARRDRFARDVAKAIELHRRLAALGARETAADAMSEDDTPEVTLMLTIMDAFAAYELAQIRRRTKAALAVKKARGEKTGGRMPYGKRFAADGRTLEDVPEEQAVIAVAKRLVVVEGKSYARVARILAKKGITRRDGAPWTGDAIAVITGGRK